MKNIKEIILEVGAGNPGAYTVIKELQWFSYWHEIITWCLKKGIVGFKLWELYKDEYKMDSYKLGKYLENEMWKDKEFEHLQKKSRDSEFINLI